VGKIAYVSPHGGEYLAILDEPADEAHASAIADFEHSLRARGQAFQKVAIPEDHPAHNLTGLHGVAHDGDSVRRFGGV
jgi:hypothetical protein